MIFTKKLINRLRHNGLDIFFVFILLATVAFISYKNYAPGTWLSGWDNLHPEFDFKLNIIRSLNAAWQEYQGVGLLGGMAHAADLPRQLFLWLVSIFIPTGFLRYFWTFLMLSIGPLGVYFLVKSVSSRAGGFVGAVFYLLNLATVQYFFVPFETFVSFYGFFPWLLFFALNYLKKGGKKKLLAYFIVSFLASGAFYVQTLFVVYVIFLSVFAIETILKLKKTGILRSIKLAFVTFAVNAFWLLPVLYFSFTGSYIPALAKINSIATPETQLMNEARGSFSDIASLKGYWFDYFDFGKDGKYDYLFKDWMDYLSASNIEIYTKIIFGIVLAGLILGRKFSGLSLLIIGYTMLATTNPPFGQIYRFLSDKIPLFSDIFRNVFTKWSVALALVYALGLGSFIFWFSNRLKGKFKVLIPLLIFALLSIIVRTVRPVFDGKLVSDRMRVNLPVEYKQLFSWFKDQPQEGRIAFFPFFNFWGWNFHSWGYDGSGFLWYGTKQPILDRAFNVWSSYNETYQNQISFALYNQDLTSFENTLKKFEVKYLLLDESVVYPAGDQKLLFVNELKDLIAGSSGRIKEAAKFGFLTVYESDNKTNEFTSTPTTFTPVSVNLDYSQIDPVYLRYGDYLQSEEGIGYPFVNFDPRGEAKINLESVGNGESLLKFENKKANAKVILPVDNKIMESFGPDRGLKEVYNCDLKKAGTVSRENLTGKRTYKATNGGVACDYFEYPSLKYEQAYVLRIKGENKQGRSFKIYLQNWQTNRMDLEELLSVGEFDQYFVILPKITSDKSQITSGYSLNLETRSFGRIASENVINNIEIYPFDINFLISLTQNSEKVITRTNNLKILGVKKYGTWAYKIETQGNGLLELGQGYDPGWLGFQLKLDKAGLNRLEHIKVNGWTNGWIIPSSQATNNYITIIFWPQLLEWGGMGLGIICLFIIVISRREKIRFPVDR